MGMGIVSVEGVCSLNHRGRMREGPGAHLSDKTQTPPRSRWPKLLTALTLWSQKARTS